MDDQPNRSRRVALGGLAGGLLATAATTAGAQAQTPAAAGAANAAPAAPKNYPKPPFPVQQQPFPGLTSKMNPRPDHGETSYKGSGRLRGRKALITGGDSGIGRAAAIAYAREGADVAINYLPAEEPDAREVVALIRAEGARQSPFQATSAAKRFARSWSKTPSGSSVAWISWSTMPRARHRKPRFSTSRPNSSTTSSRPMCMPCSGSPRRPCRI